MPDSQRNSMNLADVDVIVLCGGQGTRLRPALKTLPKAMAPISGRLFIDLLIDQFRDAGFRRFIFAVGYLADPLVEHLGKRVDVQVQISRETSPLGTGGALKKAWQLSRSRRLVVTNGDSIVPLRLINLVATLDEYDGAIAVCAGSGNYGGVDIGPPPQELIQSFTPKATGPGAINAGVYAFHGMLQDELPRQHTFSLEEDFLPNLCQSHRIKAFWSEGAHFDIGTPDRLAKAQSALRGI